MCFSHKFAAHPCASATDVSLWLQEEKATDLQTPHPIRSPVQWVRSVLASALAEVDAFMMPRERVRALD
jgi:hypothetical protein